MYSFADDASDNPTFYADLLNPQSLNKYQYAYNNPLRYDDPDGHCPECIEEFVEEVSQTPAGQTVINAAGAAATVTIVAAGGVIQKGWDWLTTPHPGFKMETQCSMGLDCSNARIGLSLIGYFDSWSILTAQNRDLRVRVQVECISLFRAAHDRQNPSRS